MRFARETAIYSAGHFLVDLGCAFAMFRFAAGRPAWAAAALLYNLLAFAGQMPLGLLADRWGRGRVFAGAGCILVSASYLLAGSPVALACAAGIGNALFHIGGGYDVLTRSGGKAGALGVFVSPGAFGLFLGALLGKGNMTPAAAPALLLLCIGAVILLLCEDTAGSGPAFSLRGAAIAALTALFLVVCLRSYAGFLFSFPWKTGLWAWVFVLCVVLGKTSGGFIYDRLGGRPAAALSLGLAAALFCLSGSPVCGCAAVLLFNMTMPLTLRAAADLLPGARGFSFGLLTLALFLGFLPEYLRLPSVSAGWTYALACLLSLALLLPVLRKRP